MFTKWGKNGLTITIPTQTGPQSKIPVHSRSKLNYATGKCNQFEHGMDHEAFLSNKSEV